MHLICSTRLDHDGQKHKSKINVYNVLGMDELGQADKSVQAFETALSINPKNVETLSQYSLVLSRRMNKVWELSRWRKSHPIGNQSATVLQWIADIL